MARKARQISGLVIDEVSLVDKGANQHAVVTIAKSADGEKENEVELYDEDGNLLDAEGLNDGDVVYDEEGQAYLFTLDADAQDQDVDTDDREDALVGKSADHNPFRRGEVSKQKKSTSTFSQDIREQLSKALTDRDRDDVIAKALATVDELSETVVKANQVAETERQIRLQHEYTEIAKSYNLPIQDETLGGVLMRCAENLSADDCEIIAKCMETAGEAIFQEYGAIGGGDNDDVLTRVSAQLDGVVSKGDNDPAEVLSSYFASNPEAYDEYLSEQQR